ncbi:MAG TPA: PQQ-dependent sugar dehydrogenase [Dehalococcoidia bacterium]|nr:PQQ-dependent sugar dehydrogenase [Dehalococcoidia bacterium]
MRLACRSLIRLVAAGGFAAFVLACSLPAAQGPAADRSNGARVSRTGSSESSGALVVDNAAAANPDLVPVQISSSTGLPSLPNPVFLPRGFSISLIAAGLNEPRFMAFDPAGNLLVGTDDGSVYRVPGSVGSVTAAAGTVPLLSGLHAPSSLAFFGGYLYVAETTQVSRYAYSNGGALSDRQTVIGGLPSGGHFTRTAVFGPDGKLYLGVGSSCNICNEQDQRRAAILRYSPDGSGYERFASGTRNAVGLAFQPGTGQLWATVNERDDQGNEIPPDLVTAVHQGDNFGWPLCQPPNAIPQDPGNNCSGITPPTVAIQAHSAPLGLAFYTGSQFPADYQGDIIAVQHGSWNRQPPAPPQLIRVHFAGGQPVSVQDFATGWQTDERGARWGRPAGVIVAPDGSLIVSDDASGYLYRISYTGQ